ncbi:MAG TPA: hypothetical protein VJ103_02645 [Candidatus Paceibacterota bacterium]|nr:hypothetical protein [Candidatus Paceibacterota bacterium]
MKKVKTFTDILHQGVGRMGFSVRVIWNCQLIDIKTVFELIQGMQNPDRKYRTLLSKNKEEKSFAEVFLEKSMLEISTNLLLKGIDYKTIDLEEYKDLSPTRKAATAFEISSN